MFRSLASSIRTPARSFAAQTSRNASTYANTTFIGRLGTDLVPTESANGKKFLRYNLAIQPNKDYPANWFQIVVFNEQQINYLTTYVKKGALLHVEATPDVQVLEAEDGSKAYRTGFIQRTVNILNNPNGEASE